MGKPYVRAEVDEPLRSDLRTWTEARIPIDAVNEKGYELAPHLTLIYGLPDGTTPDQVRQALWHPKPVETTISHPVYFRHQHQSVLVLELRSQPFQNYLKQLEAAFRMEYRLNAHVTLAYVQKGKEVPASRAAEFVGRTVRCSKFYFVTPDKEWHLL